jgi:hypothetical protein
MEIWRRDEYLYLRGSNWQETETIWYSITSVLCKFSTWGWQLFLVETCRRNKPINVHKQMCSLVGINIFLLTYIAWKMCNIKTHNKISALKMTCHKWHLDINTGTWICKPIWWEMYAKHASITNAEATYARRWTFMSPRRPYNVIVQW